MGFCYGPLGRLAAEPVPAAGALHGRLGGVQPGQSILGGGLTPVRGAISGEPRHGLVPVGLYCSGLATISLVALLVMGRRRARSRLSFATPWTRSASSVPALRRHRSRRALVSTLAHADGRRPAEPRQPLNQRTRAAAAIGRIEQQQVACARRAGPSAETATGQHLRLGAEALRCWRGAWRATAALSCSTKVAMRRSLATAPPARARPCRRRRPPTARPSNAPSRLASMENKASRVRSAKWGGLSRPGRHRRASPPTPARRR